MMTQLTVAERNKHLPGVLNKLETIMPSRIEQDQISVLKYVILWAHLSAGQGGDLGSYLRFSKAATALTNRLPQTNGLLGVKR
jgi:hypothetical protein